MLINIYNSSILYNEEHDIHVREYYLYCVCLLKRNISNESYNFIFGNYNADFNNSNTPFRIDIQYEHTLVKPGGRGADGYPIGNIRLNDNSNYLVRIQSFNYLSTLDMIMEYSLPNIENIKLSGLFDFYLRKVIHIFPIIYDSIDFSKKERSINCITMFSNIYEPRRKLLLDNIERVGLDSVNITNRFTKKDLKELYDNTKVMINIRQTDHHDTFEELRVLPALVNGVIIVSEDVPLRDKIPYSDFIIWCKYDEVLDKVDDVIKNYDKYWNSIFSDGRLETIINMMSENNDSNIKKFINSDNK